MAESKKSDNAGKVEWTCSEGCKQGTTPCKHLEVLLSTPKEEPSFEDIFKRSWLSLDNTAPDRHDSEESELTFRVWLSEQNLSPVAMDVLVLRYVYDMPFKDIVDEIGNVSFGTVWRIHNEALKLIKRSLEEK